MMVMVMTTSIQAQGLFSGPLFPSGIAYAHMHVVMGGKECMLVVLGASVGGVGYTLLMGHAYERCGPEVLMTVMLWCSSVILASAMGMRWLVGGGRRREVVVECCGGGGGSDGVVVACGSGGGSSNGTSTSRFHPPPPPPQSRNVSEEPLL